MEMTVRMSFDHDKTYEEALEHQDVRIFSIAHNEQDDKCFDDIPSNIVQLPWSRPNATTLGRDANDWSFFSATCWYYGLNLHKQINLPIGLIATSWGGTTVEAWSEPDVYNVQCPQKQSMNTRANPENDFFDQSFMGPNEHPSSLWNGMLHPFVRTTIKGAIWYQGEANEWNVGNYEQKTGYACRFPAMIASWRKHFSALEGTTDPNFPFGFVSITPWCENTCDPANQKPDTYYGPAEIRWAQQANFVNVPNRALPNVFMAMDYDLEDINVPNPPAGQIHPRNKYSVGERLALSAVKQVYEKKVTAQGPVLDGCSVSDKTIEVTFNSEELNGEFVDVKQTYGYEVEVDNSGNWYPVTIVGTKSANSIAIDASSINGAITGLRYAWRNSPCCPLLYVLSSFSFSLSSRDNSATVACVEKSCAIYNSVSDLPAVPFRVSIVDGKCVIPQ